MKKEYKRTLSIIVVILLIVVNFAFFSFDGAAAGKPRGVRQSVAFLYFYPANPRRPRRRGQQPQAQGQGQ